MAISKIKPIYRTLKKSIDYIINPLKTEDGALVSSFSCSVPTADIEMSLTSQCARETENGRIAYHLMQSFSPDDNITPEKAHELGKEFADKLLGGKYEYVIATHVDRNHIHNHIIFNATSFTDHKKYHIPVWHKYNMWKINDKICRTHNLSVIEHQSGQKGKKRYEYEEGVSGNTWKQKIRTAIDNAILSADTFEDFINIMEMEGFKVRRGKNVSYCAPGQSRATRGKQIGAEYTDENIRKRIENKGIDINATSASSKSNKPEKRFPKRNINLLIDISKNVKAQESKGYEHALVMANINTMVKTMNYLQANGITTATELTEKISEMELLKSDLEKNMEDLDTAKRRLSEKIKFSQNFVKYGKIAARAQGKLPDDIFLTEHKNEILAYNVAAIYMEKNNIDTSWLDIKGMIAEHKEMLAQKKALKSEFEEINKKMGELHLIGKNVEEILNIKILGENSKSESPKKQKSEKDIEMM